LLARVLGLSAVLVMGGVLVVWGIDLGKRVMGVSSGESGPAVSQQLAATQLDLARVTAERDALEQKLKAVETKAAAPAEISAASAVVSVADAGELAKAHANLALLESVLPPVAKGEGLVIRGLQARMASSKQLHYTILLSYGAKKAHTEFDGRLTLALMVKQGGKKSVLEFPKEGAERYDIKVARYQRVDGTLELPDGAEALTVKVTMSEKGKVVASDATTVVQSGQPRSGL
jgi:hypothetical protein